jgi:succinate dehydrogenase hydrophobic anchor subunit
MKDWLKEHITAILAVLFTVGFFGVIFIVLTRDVKTNENTTYSILASLSSIIIFILGYYFGSSKTMNEKIKSEMPKPIEHNNKLNN